MKISVYTYKIIKDITESFINEWILLEQRAVNTNLCNTHKWYKTYIETQKHKKVQIHAVYREGDLVALVPLSDSKKYGINVRASIASNYTTHCPILLESYDQQLIRYFINNLYSKSNLYIPKIGREFASMLKVHDNKAIFVLMAVSPYIVNVSADHCEDASKSICNELRKLFTKNSTTLCHKCLTDKENLRDALEVIFSIDRAGAKSTKNKALFSHSENREFYTKLIQNYSHEANICMLYYKDFPIAYTLGFNYHNNIIAYQTSYLQEYRKLSPGKLSVMLLLDKCKEEGVKYFDFCAGMNDYKLRFTPTYKEQYDLLYSKNIVVILIWKSIISLGRLKKKLFPEKYTRDCEFLFKTL